MIRKSLNRILVPVTLDEEGRSAVQRALQIQKQFDSHITFLYAVQEENAFSGLFRRDSKSKSVLRARKQLKEFIEAETGGHIPSFVRLKVRYGSLTKSTIRLINHFRYSMIFLNRKLGDGTEQGKGWKNGIRLIVGEARSAVLTYNGGDEAFEVKTIMFPVDLFQPHRKKVEWAIYLAKTLQAKVHVVAAVLDGIKEEDSSVYRKMKAIQFQLEDQNINTEFTLLREDGSRKLCQLVPDFINSVQPDLTLIMSHQERLFDFNYVGRLAYEMLMNTKPPVFCIHPRRTSILSVLR